ncbi:MAG TPA: hypothetical protein VKP30_29110 [Polyangiaceae bacterium]|nr:hypothetical protein [Polyangiaceae bacterium]
MTPPTIGAEGSGVLTLSDKDALGAWRRPLAEVAISREVQQHEST